MEGARPARFEDLDRCRTLVGEWLESLAARRGGDRLLEALPGIDAPSLVEQWASTAGRLLVVGTIDAQVVGVAAGSILASPARRVGRLECCYVEPEARTVGVGEAMVREVLALWSGQGCTEIDALALPGDRSLKALLEGTGFKTRLLTLHRPLQ